jgi:predicted transcriptional regulator
MVVQEEALAEYTILNLRMIPVVDVKQDIEWICRSFGFLESRDKEKTAARIFGELLKATKKGTGLSSDELAEKLKLSRGTMVHHLNKLMRSGLVIHHQGRYKLRAFSLQRTIEEVKRDIIRVFENINQVAKSIDENMGLLHR